MIKHNLKQIQEWNFDLSTIKKAAYGSRIVFRRIRNSSSPTPPTGDKFKIKYNLSSGETFYTVSCNSDSTITVQETSQSPYTRGFATDIVIGDCVTKVGDSSFNRFPVSSVTFSNNITEISKLAFESCLRLTSVELPQSLVTIGGQAFAYCPLTSVRIPDSVTSIGYQAFYQNSNLTNVVIGSGVTSIYSTAFASCSGLTRIDIPDSVTRIGASCFSDCSGLTNVNIGSGVTNIEQNVFENCSKLSQVTINATTPPLIGQNVFRYTSNNLVIFVPCGSLEAYKTATNWSAYTDRIQPIEGSCPFEGKINMTFFDGTTYSAECDSSTAIYSYDITSQQKLNVTDIEIGECITSLSNSVFGGSTRLSSVTLSDSVTSVGSYAFQNCNKLTDIYWGGIETIGFQAFLNSGFVELILPNTLTSIDDTGFGSCSNLQTVTIGNGISTIGRNVFNRCFNITSITILATTPPTLLSSNAFDYDTATYPIYVPSESLELYKTATNWSQIADRLLPIT